jgi:hypothetical protein
MQTYAANQSPNRTGAGLHGTDSLNWLSPMSDIGLGCSLIPGLGTSSLVIILAGSMALSAVGHALRMMA